MENLGNLTWERLQQLQEQCYPFLPACAVFSHVQTIAWLPVFRTFKMHTDVNACVIMWRLYKHQKKVCIKSWLWCCTRDLNLHCTSLLPWPRRILQTTQNNVSCLSMDAASILKNWQVKAVFNRTPGESYRKWLRSFVVVFVWDVLASANRQFLEITGEDNLTVFSYSRRVKSPEWRWQRRRADLRHFEIFRHGPIIIYTRLPAGGTY